VAAGLTAALPLHIWQTSGVKQAATAYTWQKERKLLGNIAATITEK